MQLRALLLPDRLAGEVWRMIVLRKGPTPAIAGLDMNDEAGPLDPIDDATLEALTRFVARRGATCMIQRVGEDMVEVAAEGRSTIPLATWLEGLARQAARRRSVTPTRRVGP